MTAPVVTQTSPTGTLSFPNIGDALDVVVTAHDPDTVPDPPAQSTVTIQATDAAGNPSQLFVTLEIPGGSTPEQVTWDPTPVLVPAEFTCVQIASDSPSNPTVATYRITRIA